MTTKNKTRKKIHFKDVRFDSYVSLGNDDNLGAITGDASFTVYKNNKEEFIIYIPQKDFKEMGSPKKISFRANREGLVNLGHERKLEEYKQEELVYDVPVDKWIEESKGGEQ